MPRRRSTTPTLFIVGGAEDRVGKASLLRQFVTLAGGRKARLVIVPTASSYQDEVAAAYTEVFGRIGVAGVRVVNPGDREEAHDAAAVALVDDATGVFISGGSQLRLSQVFPGTPLGEAIHRAHDRGCVVGGTSAGASIMSDFMISMGEEGVTPRQRASQLSAGLGLLPGVVVDQHFDQRARYGRLMSVIAPSPHLLGVGIDENTAIIVSDRREFTVRGAGAVFVVDCRAARTDAPEARAGAPVLVSGATVHSLPAGATFDLVQRRLTGFVEHHPDVLVALATAKA
ncbi:cyanophycinase [Nostocoides sp. Soil756]|uniref:cyanophycinase n=1 Tax=Nostocoides sp. Soil756 TaxID=1736399 RepID=UPI0006F2C861|nr:cyanophycinase [Tetrasphaera sp. Soil756]KRE62769.1 cyanophycinase [Tetrasphaera sp. Soil756]